MTALAVTCLPAQGATLSGVVLDDQTRMPVPYAQVQIEGHEPISTDSAGSFYFDIDSETVTLHASRIGYHPARQRVHVGSAIRVYLQPMTLNLERVTVTAARTSLPLDRAGAVRLLDRDQLSVGRTDPADAVRHVSSTLGRDYANYTSISLRGASTEHTLVALDGVPQNSAQLGTFDLSTLPLVAVERLEVARGGASAVFGSSAVGGVVNLITPAPERLGAEATAGLGSFGLRRLEFRHSNWVSPFGYLIAGQLYSCRNDFAWQDSLDSLRTMQNADLTRKSILAKTRFEFGPHQADLLGEFSATGRGTPGTTDWPSDSARRDDQRAQFIGSYSLQATDLVRMSARGRFSRSWQNYRDPAWATNDTHATSTAGISVDGSWHATRHTDFLLAGEAGTENLSSTAVGWPHRNTVAGIFQFRVQAFGFDVVHLLRYEWMRNTGTLLDSTLRYSTHRVLSPKVIATYTRLPLVDLYTTVGRSFRAPGFNDLYWPTDAFAYGNPRLRPETGISYELGARARPVSGLSGRVAGFASRLHDLIQWQPDSTFRFSPVNVASAQILGAELELDYAVHGFEFELDAALTHSMGDSIELPYRPRLTAGLDCSYQLPLPSLAPRFGLRVNYTGARWTDPANTASLPAYTTADLTAQASPVFGRVRLNVGAGIRNLLDTRYETAHGYPNPGRNWFAELGLRL